MKVIRIQSREQVAKKEKTEYQIKQQDNRNWQRLECKMKEGKHEFTMNKTRAEEIKDFEDQGKLFGVTSGQQYTVYMNRGQGQH